MIVYRIKNKKKESPFSNLKAYDFLSIEGNSNWGPDPSLDGGFTKEQVDSFLKGDFVCAFISMDQLYEWINIKDLKGLNKLRFHVIEINASKVIVGKHQVLIPSEEI